MINSTPSRSRTALRRLVIVLCAAVILVVFSYGWTITDIDFSVPQQPQRQENVGNALRELLSPNVFTQDYTVENTTIPFIINCPDGFTPPAAAPNETEPYIVVTPACGAANELVTIQGYNFAEDGIARVNWIATDGERRIRQVVGSTNDNFATNADGTFSVQVEVPRIRGSTGEIHTVEVQGRFPSGAPRFSDTTAIVLEKMIETIFLALIATIVSIPPSVVLSFFAAHNLMRPVRIPLGGLLITIILLPIGYLIGAALLGRLGTLALGIASGGSSAAGTAALLTLGFAAVATTRRGRVTIEPLNITRSIVNMLVIALVVIAAIGVVGGLAQLFERIAPEGLLTYVGVFFGALGDLIELSVTPLSGLVGAFTFSSIGATLTRDALKGISVPLSHILGGVLGTAAGAIVLGMTAVAGASAAWLGLIPLVVAAALAASLLPSLYRRFAVRGITLSQTDRAIIRLLSWGGAIVVFVLMFVILNVGRSLIEG